MSGLDPVGRKEVRDLIVDEAKSGKTIFFSSHILTDVEMLCDAVCILKSGEVVVSGTLDEIIDKGKRSSEITLANAPAELEKALTKLGAMVTRLGPSLVAEVQGDEAVRGVLACALEASASVESVIPKRETLESVFVRKAI
jgi:ABC-2 type transport system ATP-binding protein